jgi:hypothetical protein
MEIILALIYGIAFAAIIYYMVQLKPMYSPMEKATTAGTEYPRDLTAQIIWPWSITSYSFWPSWLASDGSPANEEYRIQPGKYGYTGRQNSVKFKQVFGNGYGYKGYGGNYSGGSSSYGFTGREK